MLAASRVVRAGPSSATHGGVMRWVPLGWLRRSDEDNAPSLASLAAGWQCLPRAPLAALRG
eukprot:5483696-Lingulodinium_polyedra.AAC.1